MKTRFLLSTVIGLTSALSLLAKAGTDTSASPLTVDEVIHRVVTTFPQVREAQAGREAATARAEQARSALLPQVDAVASYERIDPVASVTLPIGPNPTSFSFAPNNNYNAAIRLQQMLYDFGRTRSKEDVAKSGEKTAELTVEKVKRDLAYETAKVFYGIIFLQNRISVENEQIRTYEQNLQITEKKVQAGSATKFDVLTTQVRLSSAKNDKIDTQDRLNNLQATLRSLLGYTSDAPVKLKGDFSGIPARPDLQAVVAEAESKRVEHRIALAREKTANLQLASAKLGDKPSVGLGVTGGVKNGYMPELNQMKANWTFGLNVTVPIFNGHRTAGREHEAYANVRSARALAVVAERKIREEVVQAVSDVNASLDKLDNMSALLDQAREALRLAQLRYQNGTATNLELLDAQTSLREAELSDLQSRYASVLSRYALQRADGTLQY